MGGKSLLAECPADPALNEFAQGELPPDESTAVSLHLKGCTRCAERVQNLESELLLGDLRHAAVPEAPSDVEYQHAVQNLLALQPERGLRVGDAINDYKLIELIGEGGMGVVYRAMHTRLEKEVALKVIRRARVVNPLMADRFRREMKAAGKLRHENLVQATDAGVAEGVQYLVMDFVPGINLAKLVSRDGPLPLDRACDLVSQAARGLHCAHEYGLVHRDVKPSNLLLGTDGVVRVLDLGLALLPDELPPPVSNEGEFATSSGGDALTSPGQQLGTRHYTAPEQLEDSHRVDPRADIYGLGCTLVCLLTGSPPTVGKPYPPQLPTAVWEKFLAKDPSDRFSSMETAAETLAPYGPERRGKTKKRWLLAAAATIALATGLIFTLTRPQPSPEPTVEQPPPPEPMAVAPYPRSVPPGGLLPMTADEARALQKQWSEYIRQPVSVKNSLGMELVLIPPGEFGLYSTYQVTLTKPFRVGTLEVTREQFRQFAEANPEFKTETEAKPRQFVAMFTTHRPLKEFPHPLGKPVNWRTPGWGEYRDDQPITYVTWNDADAFLKWLSKKEKRTYRLPTQAEWAWACRAGSATRFYWGTDAIELGRYAWTRLSGCDRPQPVGGLRPNAWGLFDMLGNVSEMVRDYHVSPLPSGRATDPVNAILAPERITCGGSYVSFVEFSMDTLPANATNISFPSSTLGFRVVLEP